MEQCGKTEVGTEREEYQEATWCSENGLGGVLHTFGVEDESHSF